jgi:environmental stress-induced protein Ves
VRLSYLESDKWYAIDEKRDSPVQRWPERTLFIITTFGVESGLMGITTFDRARLAPTAWKNGGGRTYEIARAPMSSTMDTFDWRVSIADISADGPFSTFVGVDRVLVLLGGGGVYLQSRDGTVDHRLTEPLVPFAFVGETPIDAALVTGPSTDFNVMTRRATTRADVQVVIGDGRLGESSAGVIFAARGSWDVRSSETSFALEPDHGLWWDGETLELELRPRTVDSTLISVRVLR